MNSPYKGLMPYSEDDAPFFFGRAAEQEIIIANMNVSRLTLLYGASGVGKSSVLRAGIAHQLRQDAQKNLQERGTPEFGVIVFSSWRDDPVQALIARVQDEVARTFSNGVTSSPLHPFTSSSLTDSLNTNAHRVGGDLYIVLDQFEEYFLYHPDENGQGTFAYEFPRVLNREDLRVNFLLAIREDALAKLDRFKGHIPNLFDNYLRMEHLDTNAARDAIVKPLDEYNRLYANGSRVEIEPALVDAVLEQTRTGQVIVGESGRGAVEREGGDEIETPYLQLVMKRLWDETMRADSHTLRLETLERLGGAEKIVRTHLDTTMGALPENEQHVAANIFNFLVTPSGTKIAHTAHDLADYAHAPQNEIASTLEKLSSGDVRILRPVAPPLDQPTEPRYEIFHDVLGAPILDWRTRFTQQEEKRESEKRLAQERARVRRLRFGLIGLSLLLLGVIALAVFALTQRQEAERASVFAEQQKAEALNQRDAAQKAQADANAQKELAEQEKKNAEAAKADALNQQKIARSGELAALSLGQLTSDPERALLIAREAMNNAQTTQAEDALRTALLDPYRLTFKGKGNGITDARITPDGKYAITLEPCNTSSAGPLCGSVRIWDVQTGALLSDIKTPNEGRGIARKMDVSSDGQYLVTANDDAIARVWEIPSGKLVSELRGHEKRINSASFSPDGKQVVTASDDQTARLWDTASGEEKFNLKHPRKVKSASLSPDGKVIATSLIVLSSDLEFETDPVLFLWNATNGQVIHKIVTKTDYNGQILFSPDNQFFVIWSDGTTPGLWHLATGNKIAELPHAASGVRSLVYSPDGKFILTGNEDGTLRIYDAFTGTNLGTLLAHGRGVNDARFSANGKFIVSAGGDSRARWWLFQDTRASDSGSASGAYAPDSILASLQDLNGHTGAVNTVQFSPDGQSILTASDDGTARLWHVNAGEALIGHTNFVGKAAFSLDGKTVATASSDDTTRVWDVSRRKTLFTLPKPSDAGRTLMFSADGQKLLTVNNDGRVQVWNSETGERLWELYDQTLGISQATFVPNTQVVATFGDDLRLRLWNSTTGEKIADKFVFPPNIFELAGRVYSFAVSPDGKIIATFIALEQIKLFDAHTGAELGFLRGGPAKRAVSFSPDSKQLVAAYSTTINPGIIDDTGGLLLWDLETRQQVYDARGRFPTNAFFSPDGKYILAIYLDSAARILDANTGKLLHELKGHTAEINHAAFSPDGRFIITASNDRTARVWETATGKLIEILRGHSDIVTDASFSPDGKTIVTTGDNTARLYKCVACAPLEELLKLANARITRELTCEERVTFLRETIVCENP